jgi:hypothetical protein
MSESNYLSKLEDYLKKQNTSKKNDSFQASENSSKNFKNSTNNYKDSSSNYKINSFIKDNPIKESQGKRFDKSKSGYGVDSLMYETRNYNHLVEECLNFQDVDTKLSYDIKNYLPKDTKAGFKRKYDLLKLFLLFQSDLKSNEASKVNFNSNTIQTNNNTIRDQNKTNNFSSNGFLDKDTKSIQKQEQCSLNFT